MLHYTEDFRAASDSIGLRIQLITDRHQRREAFALRYRAYLHEGAIEGNDWGWFSDTYDMLRTSVLFGAFDEEGRIVGVLRFAVQPPRSAGIVGFRSGPEFEIFPETLAELGSDDRAIVSGSRFAIEPNHPRRSEIALLLVFALVHAGRGVNAQLGIATARGSHLKFYERFLHMKPVCEPRRMPGLLYDYNLLAVNIDESYDSILSGFPTRYRAQFEALQPFWGAEVALSLRDVAHGSRL